MDIIQIIEKKKLLNALTQQEIAFFIEGATNGTIPEYQLAALLMAIRLNGMDANETTWLTLAMADSGETADLSAIPGVPVDKHSTGGVGGHHNADRRSFGGGLRRAGSQDVRPWAGAHRRDAGQAGIDSRLQYQPEHGAVH